MLHLIDYHVAPFLNFDLPFKADRMALVPGDYAKVVFKQDGKPHSECIWVKVEDLLADGKYRGTLANDPVVVNMRYGDTVVFDWFNVVAIDMRNQTEPYRLERIRPRPLGVRHEEIIRELPSARLGTDPS